MSSGSSKQSSGSSRVDEPSLLPGEILAGKYRVDAHLAEGGMGVVLRATHLDLDCTVAIKLLRSEHISNEDAIARLLAEARIAASLRSKHVNRVLDVGRTVSGLPYLVLEYLEGSDLGGYLERRGALPVSEAADYVLQACEALAEAHAVGIVHRDLKPENLFLAEEADGGFVLKVLDFGICKAPSTRRGGRNLTDPFEVVGSPGYMSPEQVRGANVDGRTDVWALGAVLYELHTGSILFDDESLTQTFKRILDPEDLPPPFAGGSEAASLHGIVLRCLAREPEHRYQDVVELAQALTPLGSDALQGARVAKVAAAARARNIAQPEGHATPSAGTPFSLSTSRVEPALAAEERPFAPRRRWNTWSIAGAAAVAAAIAGAQQLSTPPTTSTLAAPPLAVPKPSAVATTAAAEESRPAPRSASVPSLPLPHVPRAAPTWRPAPPRAVVALVTERTSAPLAAVEAAPSSEPTLVAEAMPSAESTTVVAAHEPPLVATEEPTAHLEAAEPLPAAPKTPPSQASFDAWDPKTFGGRK